MGVLQETMRIYPTAGVGSFRKPRAGKDVVLAGGKLVVPAGVTLHMPIAAVHLNREIWDNPQAFIPERFLEVCHIMLLWIEMCPGNFWVGLQASKSFAEAMLVKMYRQKQTWRERSLHCVIQRLFESSYLQ